MNSITYLYLLFNLFFLTSCSFLKQLDLSQGENPFNVTDYQMFESHDYIDHFNFIGDSFLASEDGRSIKMNTSDLLYLNSIVKRIILNNELLIDNIDEVKFHIIKNIIPFHFSLPNNAIVISLGLIKKYIRNEGDLISVITFELLRSSRSLFYYNVVIPTGSITTDKILKLMRINLEDKKKINKWIYYVLKRANYDPYYYLNWIQQINKNSSDFIMMLGDSRQISWEEYELKNFLISKRNINKISRIKNNSSREFYSFKNNLKERSL